MMTLLYFVNELANVVRSPKVLQREISKNRHTLLCFSSIMSSPLYMHTIPRIYILLHHLDTFSRVFSTDKTNFQLRAQIICVPYHFPYPAFIIICY